MLCVYPPDSTDFSSNGLGTIAPSSALVKETLNGEYELEIVHPLDDTGKWHRLQEGYIVRAPVPSGTTPQVALAYKVLSEGKAIYRVNTKRNPLVLRSSTAAKYKKLGKYKKGKQVIVLEQTTSTLWEVVCPDGKRGYMPAASLAFVRNTSDYADAVGAVIEGRQLRDQPFRIYRVVPELDKVTAYARHIFYLQWEWLRMDEDRYGVISADDSRLSDGGFRLTLGPADVDVKVTFRCVLITE